MGSCFVSRFCSLGHDLKLSKEKEGERGEERERAREREREKEIALLVNLVRPNIGALIITYTIVGAPYYNYSIIYPPNPILIVMAPILPGLPCLSLSCMQESSLRWRHVGRISAVGSLP